MSDRIDRVSPDIGYYLAGFADGEGSFTSLSDQGLILQYLGKSRFVSMFRKRIR